ncbi:MAG: 50S ribosomal protein L15 [Candidatus Magasanikbacteria bacterium GW2011_GWA2_40_10]|uniref:Large ribosomal subunit protein uL15 n=1 Tax=Candidatus Magasanikbacteria bacterium GW2011_GWA2_40_10 TaxID=1619037 RepID=A0A0G0TBC6_9BACT|nr:MAG: 50S ribosomal protein L15 [Candidatus Magasanikbacteria bacterium GW2011_GWA2_40_10]
MSLHVHTIKPARGSKHVRKVVGRGNASGHGTFSTLGGKGQTARSGGAHGTVRRGFKFQLQSTPKLRGFTSLNDKPAEVYLSDLENSFQDGETVNLASLKEKKLISARAKTAKILSTGEITKKLVVEGVASTAGAVTKIKAVGGEVK